MKFHWILNEMGTDKANPYECYYESLSLLFVLLEERLFNFLFGRLWLSAVSLDLNIPHYSSIQISKEPNLITDRQLLRLLSVYWNTQLTSTWTDVRKINKSLIFKNCQISLTSFAKLDQKWAHNLNGQRPQPLSLKIAKIRPQISHKSLCLADLKNGDIIFSHWRLKTKSFRTNLWHFLSKIFDILRIGPEKVFQPWEQRPRPFDEDWVWLDPRFAQISVSFSRPKVATSLKFDGIQQWVRQWGCQHDAKNWIEVTNFCDFELLSTKFCVWWELLTWTPPSSVGSSQTLHSSQVNS